METKVRSLIKSIPAILVRGVAMYCFAMGVWGMYVAPYSAFGLCIVSAILFTCVDLFWRIK